MGEGGRREAYLGGGGVVLMGAIPWAFLPLVRRLGVGPGLILGTGGLEASQGVCPLTCEAEVWGAPGLHTRAVRAGVRDRGHPALGAHGDLNRRH